MKFKIIVFVAFGFIVACEKGAWHMTQSRVCNKTPNGEYKPINNFQKRGLAARCQGKAWTGKAKCEDNNLYVRCE